MKFELIYGRSGTGKSHYIYEDIKNNINNNLSFLFCIQYNYLSFVRSLHTLYFKTNSYAINFLPINFIYNFSCVLLLSLISRTTGIIFIKLS